MAHFFIHRPVFAWVLAIIVMLAGAFGLATLPIAQYPQIAPTTVRISATYTGASAGTVENSVTTVIEDGLTGLDGMLYMTADSSEGRASISLVFADSVDPDMAQVQVQNKLQLVQSSLPAAVTARGVSVTRSTTSILLVGALVSEDGRFSSLQLGDIMKNTMQDAIQRLDGVGSINLFSSKYAMRIWLDPERLYQYQLTPSDVTSAVADQNTNVTVGSLGDAPILRGQQLTVALSAQSQLSTVEDFQRILLKPNADGAAVYLADVARVELGAEDYGTLSRYNRHPAAGFGVNLATGANAVETAVRVKARIEQLKAALPEGVSVTIPYDTAPFVEQSIAQVYHTLGEAIALVFLVILVFLQSWRATLIPTIAVPVVLLGTFGMLAALGMSINTLTMFAMVLAIGLLVDDAIVVVENVERVMAEEGLGPVEATEKSMAEISPALVGIVLVLSAVFLPMAFMSGSTGVIYRQFSVTIITAMVLSLFVALILTPAMCATLLRKGHPAPRLAPARWFNAGLGGLTAGYLGSNRRILRRPFLMLLVLLAAGFWGWRSYQALPTSFLPAEDQGAALILVTLPDGATWPQTLQAIETIEDYFLNEPSVESVFGVVGFSFGGTGQNRGLMFARLKDYAARPGQDLAAIVQRANARLFFNRMGQIIVIQPPPIPGMGNTSGFSMYLVDQTGNGTQALAMAADALVAAAQADGRVTGLRGNESTAEPSLRLKIDQQKAEAFGLTLANINGMLSTVFAGRYVNDFTLGNSLREVIVQGDAAWRMQPEDVTAWYARNADDDMVPLGAVIYQSWTQTASKLSRYGGSPALEISGSAAPGLSSGAAMDAMEQLVAALPGGYGAAWTGLSYQERLSGHQEPLLYSLSALVVFLCLAALYESWTVPFAVMLVVPVGLLGALLAALHFGQANDVYFKVGLLTTIGLSARNAILIVEFAETLRLGGRPLIEATLTAARQRLRPILMTTLAFGLGILPLILASGAGAAAQHSIGIGMMGGIVFNALFGLMMVPAFYAAVMRVFARGEVRG